MVILSLLVSARAGLGAAGAPLAQRGAAEERREFNLVYDDRSKTSYQEIRRAAVGEPFRTERGGPDAQGNLSTLIGNTPDAFYPGGSRVIVQRGVTLSVRYLDPDHIRRQGSVPGVRIDGRVAYLNLGHRDVNVDLAVAAIEQHRASLQAVSFWFGTERENARVVAALLLTTSPALSVDLSGFASGGRADLKVLLPLASRLHVLSFGDPGTRNLALLPRYRELRYLGVSGVARAVLLPLAARLSLLRELSVGQEPVSAADLAQIGRMTGLRALHVTYGGNGSGLAPLARLRQLESLSLVAPINRIDGGLRYLAELPLARLEISGGQLKEADLDALGRVRSLVSLWMSGLRPTRLAFIVGLTKLERMTLSAASLAQGAVGYLARATALRRLVLDRCSFVDRTPLDLARLVRLERVEIRDTRIPGAAPGRLARLPKLRILYLMGAGVRDQDLPPLGKLTSLEELWLGDNPLTDAALAHLAPLQKLRVLDSPDGVTRKARDSFARSHPGCRVH